MDRMIHSISEKFDANLAQHFLTARIADVVTSEMIPKFRKLPEVKGRVVIGNPPGDFHALGKRIVIGCLRSRLIEVMDLGENAPAEKFVDMALQNQAPVIAISSLMVYTATGENVAEGQLRMLAKYGHDNVWSLF
jgi:methanogenic corrinoid protein MtbC1